MSYGNVEDALDAVQEIERETDRMAKLALAADVASRVTTMPTRDELQRLSDAASPGLWSIDVRDLYMDGRSAIYVRGPEPGIRISMVSNVADVELAVALVNAFRAGELVAAEPGAERTSDEV